MTQRDRTFFLLLALLSSTLFMQAQVSFIVDSIPLYTSEEDVPYIAGNFNGWNPGDELYALQKNDQDKWSITLEPAVEGTQIEFKFTLGEWAKVEKGPDGEEIANRTFTFGNGDTVHVIIYNWAINGSTAAENVTIIDDSFYIPQLDRYRRIWLYLPPDYEESGKSYPVLYMHDGQNLFDGQTSFAGEWEVDETLNKLASQAYQVPIVVGIDNGGEYRIDELAPWFNDEYQAGGEGENYVAFIVETLKPYIDEHYRTLKGRDDTGMLGSSLGALLSIYGALDYQDIFSKVGAFSPAYWFNEDSLWNFVSETGKQKDIRFYQSIGDQEGSAYITMMHSMEDTLNKLGFSQVISKEIEGGQHNEQTWRDNFEEAYLWLFVNYANDVNEKKLVKPLILYPNPAINKIRIKNIKIDLADHVLIINSSGRLVYDSAYQLPGGEINIGSLNSGNYIMKIRKDNELYIGKFVKF